MKSIKKILFVTDLSDHAAHAYQYAVAMAERFGAGIVVLHVLEGTSSVNEEVLGKWIGARRMSELKAKAREEARDLLIGKKRHGVIVQEALECFCSEVQQGCEEESRVSSDAIVITEGKVVDGILNTCKETDCDMIVMAHPVRRVIDEPLFGATTRGVLRKSTHPVLLVPPPQ
ncbi:MAG: universal stress protein [Desulfatibacillum sp.]|nr:universal stress protein [Desulfatibacillum sp.]